MGHIMDLPKSTLGINLDKDFAPDYQMMADKKKIISELKTAAKTAEKIILATDPDREGEAIAAHIKELLEEQKPRVRSKFFSALLFMKLPKKQSKRR